MPEGEKRSGLGCLILPLVWSIPFLLGIGIAKLAGESVATGAALGVMFVFSGEKLLQGFVAFLGGIGAAFNRSAPPVVRFGVFGLGCLIAAGCAAYAWGVWLILKADWGFFLTVGALMGIQFAGFVGVMLAGFAVSGLMALERDSVRKRGLRNAAAEEEPEENDEDLEPADDFGADDDDDIDEEPEQLRLARCFARGGDPASTSHPFNWDAAYAAYLAECTENELDPKSLQALSEVLCLSDDEDDEELAGLLEDRHEVGGDRQIARLTTADIDPNDLDVVLYCNFRPSAIGTSDGERQDAFEYWCDEWGVYPRHPFAKDILASRMIATFVQEELERMNTKWQAERAAKIELPAPATDKHL